MTEQNDRIQTLVDQRRDLERQLSKQSNLVAQGIRDLDITAARNAQSASDRIERSIKRLDAKIAEAMTEAMS